MRGKVIVFRIKIVDEHFLLAASPCSFLSRPVSQLPSPPYQPPYVTSPTDQLYRRKIKSAIDLLPCYKLGERHSHSVAVVKSKNHIATFGLQLHA